MEARSKRVTGCVVELAVSLLSTLDGGNLERSVSALQEREPLLFFFSDGEPLLVFDI